MNSKQGKLVEIQIRTERGYIRMFVIFGFQVDGPITRGGEGGGGLYKRHFTVTGIMDAPFAESET